MKKKPKKLDSITLIKLDQYNGSLSVEKVDEFITFKKSLRVLNKEPYFKLNRKGILCEIIGIKGTVKRIGVAKYRDVFYFDGNRLGKRKMKVVLAALGGELPTKINPSKMGKQCR